jgi:hypothetical protein
MRGAAASIAADLRGRRIAVPGRRTVFAAVEPERSCP